MSYGTIFEHQEMFYDQRRNALYEAAINAAVSKDSVVLDLGAGLGLHGHIAANCGAKKVYLVEPSRILTITRQLVDKSDSASRTECLSGTIEEVELEDPVDVIVSVFTGNFLLSEDLLPSLFYARDKYLKEGGVLIPDCGTMVAAGVSVADFYAKNIDKWQSPMAGLDVSQVRAYATNQIYCAPASMMKPSLLTNPVDLHTIDFMTAREASCDQTIELTADKDGLFHGVLGWFTARVGSALLSTGPDDPPMHWSQMLLPCSVPFHVSKGDKITFRLQRPDFGEWTWTIHSSRGGKQRQSTFLSEPRLPSDMLKKSRSYAPQLNGKGDMLSKTLNMMNGQHANQEIIDFLMLNYSTTFHNEQAAQTYVTGLAERYG